MISRRDIIAAVIEYEWADAKGERRRLSEKVSLHPPMGFHTESLTRYL